MELTYGVPYDIMICASVAMSCQTTIWKEIQTKKTINVSNSDEQNNEKGSHKLYSIACAQNIFISKLNHQVCFP